MSIAPDIFRSIDPPDVWVTLAGLETPEHDSRQVVLRVKPQGQRSISVTEWVSRYAPEWSILRGVAHAVIALEHSQARITRGMLETALREGLQTYVEPF